MANLPNKSFVFNFNAKNYNPSTFTIPNEEGATMDMDMVWSATTTAVRNNIQFVDGDHISVPLSAYSLFDFSTSGANPMNNTASAPAMTIVAKFKITNTNSGANFICNRGPGSGNSGDNYNWMARTGSGMLSLHTSSSNASASQVASYTQSSVITAVWRVNTSRQIEIKNLTQGTSNTPFTSSWKGGSRWFTFFIWKSASSFSEPVAGDFYWCYASREVLTDAEIRQVINFNESSFGPDEDSADVQASGGTVSINLSAEGVSWTASTASNWITISPTTGTGDSTVTLTVKANNFSERTGTVTFTSGAGDEAEFTVNQGGTDGIVPYKKIYRNDRRIN